MTGYRSVLGATKTHVDLEQPGAGNSRAGARLPHGCFLLLCTVIRVDPDALASYESRKEMQSKMMNGTVGNWFWNTAMANDCVFHMADVTHDGTEGCMVV